MRIEWTNDECTEAFVYKGVLRATVTRVPLKVIAKRVWIFRMGKSWEDVGWWLNWRLERAFSRETARKLAGRIWQRVGSPSLPRATVRITSTSGAWASVNLEEI